MCPKENISTFNLIYFKAGFEQTQCMLLSDEPCNFIA